MQRIITLRYAGKCKSCGNSISAGSRAVWLGKGQGVKHESCDETPTVSTVPDTTEQCHTFTADYAKVRDVFSRINKRDYSDFPSGKQRNILSRFHEWWERNTDWTGCTLPEMNSWISNGFHVEGLRDLPPLIVGRPKRKLRFAEEGDELLIDLAWSVVDEHYAEWEKRNSKPGLSVEVEITYSASTKAEVIRKYQVWLARMFQTLDENRVDAEIVVSCLVKGYMAPSDVGQKYDTRIRVKRAGEAADFAAWSAMFSPGGYRMLMFAAKVMQVESMGKETDTGLGMPIPSPAFDIQYDADANVMRVTQAQGMDFPEFEMTQKLARVLGEING